jgi:hypothetical protein
MTQEEVNAVFCSPIFVDEKMKSAIPRTNEDDQAPASSLQAALKNTETQNSTWETANHDDLDRKIAENLLIPRTENFEDTQSTPQSTRSDDDDNWTLPSNPKHTTRLKDPPVTTTNQLSENPNSVLSVDDDLDQPMQVEQTEVDNSTLQPPTSILLSVPNTDHTNQQGSQLPTSTTPQKNTFDLKTVSFEPGLPENKPSSKSTRHKQRSTKQQGRGGRGGIIVAPNGDYIPIPTPNNSSATSQAMEELTPISPVITQKTHTYQVYFRATKKKKQKDISKTTVAKAILTAFQAADPTTEIFSPPESNFQRLSFALIDENNNDLREILCKINIINLMHRQRQLVW